MQDRDFIIEAAQATDGRPAYLCFARLADTRERLSAQPGIAAEGQLQAGRI